MGVDVNKRLERIEYYLELLAESGILKEAPFANWVIKNNLSKKEVDKVLLVCEEVEVLYNKQKAEGFIHFQPLLQMFQEKTHPYINDMEEFTFMMVRENLFANLMKEFLKIQHHLD